MSTSIETCLRNSNGRLLNLNLERHKNYEDGQDFLLIRLFRHETMGHLLEKRENERELKGQIIGEVEVDYRWVINCMLKKKVLDFTEYTREYLDQAILEGQTTEG